MHVKLLDFSNNAIKPTLIFYTNSPALHYNMLQCIACSPHMCCNLVRPAGWRVEAANW